MLWQHCFFWNFHALLNLHLNLSNEMDYRERGSGGQESRGDRKNVCVSLSLSPSLMALFLAMYSLMYTQDPSHTRSLPRNPMMHLSQPRAVSRAYSHLPDESEYGKRVRRIFVFSVFGCCGGSRPKTDRQCVCVCVCVFMYLCFLLHTCIWLLFYSEDWQVFVVLCCCPVTACTKYLMGWVSILCVWGVRGHHAECYICHVECCTCHPHIKRSPFSCSGQKQAPGDTGKTHKCQQQLTGSSTYRRKQQEPAATSTWPGMSSF